MKTKTRSMHVATIKRSYKGKQYCSVLLRRTYRDGGKVKHQTLGNLSDLPPDVIDYIRRRLAGEPPSGGGNLEIIRSLPHGHVAATLGVARKIGLESVIGSKPSRERDLTMALIVARVITPASKLATLVGLREETAKHTLAEELGLGAVQTPEIYEALDWLLKRQTRIENKLAKKHLMGGTLVLYDVSSSYYTGRRPSLVKFGYSRDGKKGFPQIVYGLLCNSEGCPIAAEVFEGNTADPTTLAVQIKKVRQRFGMQRVVLVGDRGMITSQRIEEEFREVDGLDWITALRNDGIRKLLKQGTIQRSLFDEQDLAEVCSEEFPGERLLVCRNPLLADERTRKRKDLLEATETELEKIAARVRRQQRPLRGKDQIGLCVGRVLNRFKMAKHFELDIQDDQFVYRRREEKIAEEAALDGLYVVRTSVKSTLMSAEDAVRAYKSLSHVERAFRSLKTVDLKLRPIFHWKDDRIRAHVFLCMLAFYVEWHMRSSLSELLFDDPEREAAEQTRKSIVAPAPRSATAKRKDQSKRTVKDQPAQSFNSLLQDLATLCRNRVRAEGTEFTLLTTPTAIHNRVFELLDINIAP